LKFLTTVLAPSLVAQQKNKRNNHSRDLPAMEVTGNGMEVVEMRFKDNLRLFICVCFNSDDSGSSVTLVFS